MGNLIAGIVVAAATLAVFIYCLPRHGVRHRFVETEWEPYVGVAFCTAVALSFTLMLSGVIALAGGA